MPGRSPTPRPRPATPPSASHATGVAAVPATVDGARPALSLTMVKSASPATVGRGRRRGHVHVPCDQHRQRHRERDRDRRDGVLRHRDPAGGRPARLARSRQVTVSTARRPTPSPRPTSTPGRSPTPRRSGHDPGQRGRRLAAVVDHRARHADPGAHGGEVGQPDDGRRGRRRGHLLVPGDQHRQRHRDRRSRSTRRVLRHRHLSPVTCPPGHAWPDRERGLHRDLHRHPGRHRRRVDHQHRDRDRAHLRPASPRRCRRRRRPPCPPPSPRR